MKKVLMIAPYFLPRRRVGALRPFKFAIHLKKKGWTPVILTIASPADSFTDNEKKLLSDIKMIRIIPPFDRTSSAGGDTADNTNKQTGSPGFFDKAAMWFDKQMPLDTWLLLFGIKLSWILKQVRAVEPDLIWSTGDPWSGHWLAGKVSARTGKSWVADFRDPWTLASVNLRNRSGFSSFLDRKAEKKIVEQAGRLVFTSEATRKLYTSHYRLSSSKTHTIYNSFDTSLYASPAGNEWSVNPDSSTFNILFFGRFRRLSSSAAIAAAMRYLQLNDPDTASLIRIHSFGNPDPEEEKIIRDSGLSGRFIFHEPVVPEKTLAVLQKADLLLLSTSRERKHIIPAKLWDYLASGRPVLSIAPNPEIGTILEQCGAGVQFRTGEEQRIAQFLTRSAEAWKTGEKVLPEADEEKLALRRLWDADHAAGKLAEIFNREVGHV